jgi:hypothetical protein
VRIAACGHRFSKLKAAARARSRRWAVLLE